MLLASSHEVLNKGTPELGPGVDGAFLQTEEPLVRRLVDDHWQVVGYDIFAPSCCSDVDLIEH
jgi:hypothetical protein